MQVDRVLCGVYACESCLMNSQNLSMSRKLKRLLSVQANLPEKEQEPRSSTRLVLQIQLPLLRSTEAYCEFLLR